MLGLLAVLPLASAGHALLTVTGADDACCAAKVAAALDAVPGVEGASASFETGSACVRLSGALDPGALGAALTAAGYGLVSAVPVDACPAALAISAPDPWEGVTDIDLAHVSRGEAIDLAAVLAPGRFTIVDFGATWCAPCRTAVTAIHAYAKRSPDVSVRAVLLEGADPRASFAQPIVKQHLQFAEGLPYFLAFDPKGKRIYAGSDLDSLFAAIDRKRK